MGSVQPAMRRFGSILIPLCGALSLFSCAKETQDDAGADGDDTTGTSGITVSASSPTSNTASETNETGTMSASVGTEEADASVTATEEADNGTESVDSGGSSGTATGNDPDNPIDCGGQIWQCGDGEDNDGDGYNDLMDPECTGPCDDDEGSYQTGIPGDNVDCKQDCFFDGNSGQGDDGCIWDLKCDEANPGEFIGCEYSGGNNCENSPPNQSEECIMFCEQYVPPGCDCFGCCTVCGEEGCVDIFLNGDPDCNVDNLEACTMCTSQIEDCGNPCVPEDCEICFGETEPPEGCGENECLSDLPCSDNPDCPTDYFCYLGCCYPPPPG